MSAFVVAATFRIRWLKDEHRRHRSEHQAGEQHVRAKSWDKERGDASAEIEIKQHGTPRGERGAWEPAGEKFVRHGGRSVSAGVDGDKWNVGILNREGRKEREGRRDLVS